MGMKNMVTVDIKKIDGVLKGRGMLQKDMGAEMGHDYTFISGVRARGTMQKNDALLFKSLYGVDVEIKEDIPTEAEKVDFDYAKLHKIIAGAIDYDRLAECMKQTIDYDKLSDAVCRAMVKALEGDKPKTFERRKLE